MRNTYAGTCYRCGTTVKAGKGHFERFGRHHRKKHPNAPFSMKWLLQHADCAIRYRNTDKSVWKEQDMEVSVNEQQQQT